MFLSQETSCLIDPCVRSRAGIGKYRWRQVSAVCLKSFWKSRAKFFPGLISSITSGGKTQASMSARLTRTSRVYGNRLYVKTTSIRSALYEARAMFSMAVRNENQRRQSESPHQRTESLRMRLRCHETKFPQPERCALRVLGGHDEQSRSRHPNTCFVIQYARTSGREGSRPYRSSTDRKDRRNRGALPTASAHARLGRRTSPHS